MWDGSRIDINLTAVALALTRNAIGLQSHDPALTGRDWAHLAFVIAVGGSVTDGVQILKNVLNELRSILSPIW